MSKPKWVSYDSYYNNLTKAIRFGCEEGLLETGVEVEDNTSLGEYLKHLEGVYKKIVEVCSAGK